MKTYIPVLAIFLMAMISHAAPGDLDRTFSRDGKLTDWAGYANGVAIQADGKIVVAGWVSESFAVARYNPDGSADLTFGDNGRVTTAFGSEAAESKAVAVQSDGKIVVAGYACPCDDWGSATFAVARYNSDGSLDSSFDGDGKLSTTVGDRATGYSVAIQTNSKIVVAGWSWIFGPNKDHFALARYNSDGSLDSTFDGDGKMTTSICSTCNDEAFSVAVQSDGKIVAVGGGYDGTFNTKFEVARYTPDGSLDTTFDSDGIVTITSGEWATAVTTQQDGKIVAAAAVGWNASSGFTLVRYNSNGSLDTTFDFDGKVSTPGFSCNGIAIQSDGKIVATGFINNGLDDDFALVRYDPNGSLDSSFGGGDGKTTVDFSNSRDQAFGMALDKAGRAVVVGKSSTEFAIARFLLDHSRVDADFDGDGRSDISVFRPSGSVWYLDQSTAGFSAAQFGLLTDKITPADYDGDGKTDIAVFREGTWYCFDSSSGNFHASQFGLAGDVPVPADYTGDGRADLAIYRSGTWWTYDPSSGQTRAVQFGTSEDNALPADFDGDGKVDIAVFRPSNGYWYILRSSDNDVRSDAFGADGDVPLRGDFNGDSRADLAVFRPSNGTWYIARPTGFPAQNFDPIQFGVSTDIPVPADYDGDGKTDVAVYRGGLWYLLQSTAGFAVQRFGLPDDRPVPAAFTSN